MLKSLLENQRQSINYFIDRLDVDQAYRLLETLVECSGSIFFTGVGKSGLIAKKIAVTLVSTGTKALYISPVDAVHGDLGMLSDQDVFVFISKSGESDELLSLVPAIRNKGAKMVGIVCNEKSRLANACHQTITLPLLSELCPFDLAPTNSTTVQLMFGDLLAVALMNKKNFTKEAFIQNHPAGRIGKRLTMKVKDLMVSGSGIPLSSPEDKLVNTLVELSNKKCGCVLIVDSNKRLLGIFTDGDLRRALQTNGGKVVDTPMGELMTSNPRWIDSDVLAWDAMKRMEADPLRPITVLPVIAANHTVVGIIKLHDIVQSGL
jgi:arabinose-5-phosphate isomerase